MIDSEKQPTVYIPLQLKNESGVSMLHDSLRNSGKGTDDVVTDQRILLIDQTYENACKKNLVRDQFIQNVAESRFPREGLSEGTRLTRGRSRGCQPFIYMGLAGRKTYYIHAKSLQYY